MNISLFAGGLSIGISELIAYDVLHVLRRMSLLSEMDTVQLEGVAAFYSGGLLSTLRLLLKRGSPIDEEQFIGIIAAFLNEKSAQAGATE
ncbi:MAG: hypothetical protein MR913_12760 [Clostridiales bacterium]|nr:hypothetical protein [Clostridiales bacterium]